MPCADDPAVHHDGHGHDVVLTDIGTPCGDHHHNPEDACSPLCFCHCCHTHISYEEAEFFFGMVPHFTPLNSHFSERETSSYIHPPLRPPQV